MYSSCKIFKAIFISAAISYLINNRCLIKCKLVLYPWLYLLNLLLTVFTNFVSSGSKAFCKPPINTELKRRHFLYVLAPALAASSIFLRDASVFLMPTATVPGAWKQPSKNPATHYVILVFLSQNSQYPHSSVWQKSPEVVGGTRGL